jgi:exodeoxyribonuclease VII small subunit
MSTAPEQTTYEDGIKELEEIISALETGGLGVTETVAKCRRAKALEKALREHLDSCEGQLKEIEQNENLPEIRIIGGDEDAEPVASVTGDFEPSTAAGFSSPTDAIGDGVQEDDIPF